MTREKGFGGVSPEGIGSLGRYFGICVVDHGMTFKVYMYIAYEYRQNEQKEFGKQYLEYPNLSKSSAGIIENTCIPLASFPP